MNKLHHTYVDYHTHGLKSGQKSVVGLQILTWSHLNSCFVSALIGK